MSAFLCNDEHINAMVRFALTQTKHGPPCYRWGGHWQNYITTNTAQVLVDANYQACDIRYGMNRESHQINYSPFGPDYSPVEIIKACNCYNYQAGEIEDYEGTEVAEIVKAIRELAIENLPGYDAAQWSIIKPPISERVGVLA